MIVENLLCSTKSYENLCEILKKEVRVIECDLRRFGFHGLYRKKKNDRGSIYIEESLTIEKKKEYLFEEYAHHLTSSGNILDQSTLESRVQETIARNKALDMSITIDNIQSYLKNGVADYKEIASHLGFTAEYVEKGILRLIQKQIDISEYRRMEIANYGN